MVIPLKITFLRVNEIRDMTPEAYAGRQFRLEYQIYEKDKDRVRTESRLLSEGELDITVTEPVAESWKNMDREIEGTAGTIALHRLTGLGEEEEYLHIPETLSISEDDAPVDIPELPLVKPGTELQLRPAQSNLEDRLSRPQKHV